MFRIEIDYTQTMLDLDRIQRRQLPFATALALTRTGQDAQAKVREELPGRFRLTSQWVPRGIRITPATKSNPEVVVYSRDQFMALQETGGTKRPGSHRFLAVPRDGVKRTQKGRISKAGRPGRVMQKSNTFIDRAPGGMLGIWQRRTKKRVNLLYVLTSKADIKPRFGFFETVTGVARDRFEPRFNEAMRRAVGS